MILTGSEILKNIKKEKIIIEPFSKGNLNQNSYNFTLGKTIKIYKDHTLDVTKNNKTISLSIDQDGFTLKPGVIYLAHTEEIIGSKFYVPMIKGRSSIGRLGLFINITADLINLGSIEQYVLQLHVVQTLIIYPGIQIGQVTFWKPKGEVLL